MANTDNMVKAENIPHDLSNLNRLRHVIFSSLQGNYSGGLWARLLLDWLVFLTFTVPYFIIFSKQWEKGI